MISDVSEGDKYDIIGAVQACTEMYKEALEQVGIFNVDVPEEEKFYSSFYPASAKYRFSADFSKFDGSIKGIMKKIVVEMLAECVADDRDAVEAFNRLLFSKGVYMKTLGGITFRIVCFWLATTLSGGMGTTLENTLLSRLVFLFAIWYAVAKLRDPNLPATKFVNGEEVPVIYGNVATKGDDCHGYVTVENEDGKLKESMEEVFCALGFNIKLVEENPGCFTFCSAKWVEVDDGVVKKFVLPGRILIRLPLHVPATALGGRKADTMGVCKALSACFECKGQPVVQEYALMQLRITSYRLRMRSYLMGGAERLIGHEVTHNKELRMKLERQGICPDDLPDFYSQYLRGNLKIREPITPNIRSAWADTFGVEPTEQEYVEKFFSNVDEATGTHMSVRDPRVADALSLLAKII